MGELVKCSTCGNDVSSTAKVCPHCGEKNFMQAKPKSVKIVQCIKCGKDVDNSEKKCPHCGTVLFTKAQRRHALIGGLSILIPIAFIVFWVTVIPAIRGFWTVGTAIDGDHYYKTVYTRHTDMSVIREYALNQRWDPGEFLTIFFYDDREYTPDLVRMNDPAGYPAEYRKHCIALFIRNCNNEVTLNDLRDYNKKVYK